MFTDITLCKDQLNNLGFSKVINTERIIEIDSRSELSRKINKNKLIIVQGGKFNKEILQNKKVDILLNPEKNPEKDFIHQRNSGLNQSLCKLAKKNNIAIGISFNEILRNKSIRRAILLGRIKQNIKLCRKYKVRMVFASFAEDVYEQRAAKDLINFITCLGMTASEAESSLSVINKIIEEKKVLIMPGLKLLEQ